MYERNYPCDSLIAVYFGVLFPPSPPASPSLLQKFTYLCMQAQVQPRHTPCPAFPLLLLFTHAHPLSLCNQTLEMKSDIEVRRSRNEHGTLTWQLGEIWPTGGWGSVEYGSVGWLDGQVLGGRWKPLHHVMEQHLYRDVVAICGADALCFVRNSNPLHAVAGELSAVLFNLQSQAEVHVSSVAVHAAPGPSSQHFCLGQPDAAADCPPYSSILAAHACTASSCLLILRLRLQPSRFVSVSEENVVFIVPPANMTIPASSISFNVSQPHVCITRPSNTCSTVRPHHPPPPPSCIAAAHTRMHHRSTHSTLTCPPQVFLSVASSPALFVSLVTLEQGRFLRNSLFLVAGEHTVEFLHMGKPQGSLLHDSLRVEHLHMYL
jgi:hypothetical protein